MKKGKLGIRLAFYGVLAFVLAYLGYSTLLFLVLGVALLVEKDEWTIRQIIQAVVLCFIESIVRNVLNIIGFADNIPFLGTAWNIITSTITALLELAVLGCTIIGVLRNVKDQDAAIPFAKTVADWAFGVVKEKAVPAKAAIEEKKDAVSEQESSEQEQN